MKPYILVSLAVLAIAPSIPAETISPLLSRGFTVLPPPQKVTLGARDVEFTPDWRIEAGPGADGDAAKEELTQQLATRFHLTLASGKGSGVLRLAIAPNTIAVKNATDQDTAALAEQAYRLSIRPESITIAGNSPAGLFYGIQTFIQLLKPQSEKVWLPEGSIEDWPDMQLRVIYWDDAHHLEHLNDLKAAIRQASFYKINGFAIKLEGHFQYAHAPAIVDPYALSPADFQALTDYGLKQHVQVIPYLDGPAHDSFILKHPEYAKLREYPENNYEFCATNPDTYKLLDAMFDDLLDANKGGKYFVLSTDEPYYVGLAANPQCREADQAKQLGSVGKLLAEFITKTAGYLHERGRTVIFWGEYPMKPDDIGALPSYLINGEVYGPRFDPVFREHGIRQMVYTSTEGEEQLFPRYYPLPAPTLLHPGGEDSAKGRVQDMLDSVSLTSLSDLSSTRAGSAHSGEPDLLGAFVAGWADAGLHPETFWLGYATGPAAAWNRNATHSPELQSCFYSLFYGRESTNMGRLYQLMSGGAQAWEDTWDTGPSSARKPIWGDSYSQFHPARPARDQYLAPLPVPSADSLHLTDDWRAGNQRRLDLGARSLAENDELLDLLYANAQRVQFNRYNLAVYLSIAGLYRQNLTMLQDLGRMADLLKKADHLAAEAKPAQALESIDRALDLAEGIRKERNTVLRNATATWYQTWRPRVAEANGRSYLHELDDVKDHQPMRTVDMSYLVYRELLFPFENWASGVVAARNQYATHKGLAIRDFHLHWKELDTR